VGLPYSLQDLILAKRQNFVFDIMADIRAALSHHFNNTVTDLTNK
jgi:hypothetical protein